jgi:protein SCO1/2
MARVSDQAKLDFLLKELGVVIIPDEFGGYQHNAAIHVVDRGGRVAHILDYDVSSEQIQQVVQQL